MTKKELIERCAITAHMVNRMYCQMLGDDSQPLWEQAPDWQKNSARAGVKAILADPKTTPEQSHANWMALKKKEGWTYGKIKDAVKKTHPCMVSYHLLPTAQLMKDTIFGAVVRGAAAEFKKPVAVK